MKRRKRGTGGRERGGESLVIGRVGMLDPNSAIGTCVPQG